MRWISIVLAGVIVQSAAATDWAQWRGPEQNGNTREKAVVTEWSLDGKNVVWKSDVGGRANPIVMQGRVFVITPVGEGASLQERVVCMDAATGKTVWEYRFPVFHSDIVENRVGFTSIAGDEETGNVYVHGTGGELFCFDRDGKILWKHSLTEEFGRISGYGGRLHTPIIDEERVIISCTCSSWGEYAKPGHRYYAFDKKTGVLIWSAAPGGPPTDTTCACPVVAVIGGKRLLIAPNVDGSVYAMLSRTGQMVWSYKFSKRPLNTMPSVDGDLVYLTHSEENEGTTEMGSVLCLNGAGTGELGKSAEVWRRYSIEAGYAAPALANGRLYVLENSAGLIALDAKTGKDLWRFKAGNLGKGSPVVTSDGVIYLGSQAEYGVFWILKDAGDKAEVLQEVRFPAVNGTIDEMLGSPAVAGGRVYFQTRYATYCLGVKDAKVAADPIPPMPAEAEPPADGKAVQQWTPCEVTLRPGEKFRLTPHAFHSNGTPFKGPFSSQQPQFEVKGVRGKINPETTEFTADEAPVFSAGTITCKWIGDPVTVRVRVCPPPPFVVDFESAAVDSVPPGWLNVINKTKVVEKDGGKVLKKLAERPSPPFMRIRTYMTPSIAGGYTIEADMWAGRRKTAIKEFWPDMGLINSRYELRLMGNDPSSPYLRIVHWDSIPRLQKDVPFAWQPETWYRVKFQVKIDGGTATLSGKVWERDKPEPAEWTITATDAFPSTEGSPALYAYSNGTTEKSNGPDIFFDNVKVTKE